MRMQSFGVFKNDFKSCRLFLLPMVHLYLAALVISAQIELGEANAGDLSKFSYRMNGESGTSQVYECLFGSKSHTSHKAGATKIVRPKITLNPSSIRYYSLLGQDSLQISHPVM